MTYDGRITSFLGQGLIADRPASLTIHPDAIGFYWSTDSLQMSVWVDGAWSENILSGVVDGDKGGITVSGGGTSWSLNAGSVTLAKLADLAANSIIGNNTGSAATPIALNASQVKALLSIAASDVSGLATVATTGAAADLSGLASIATSGSANDLGSGTVPVARLPIFDSTNNGAVPASGGSATDFLKANGAWGPATINDGDKGDISISGGVWSIDADAPNIVNKVQYVATRTALAAAGVSVPVAYLYEAGREGTFVFISSDVSANVSGGYAYGDTSQGIWVLPSWDTSGVSGVWARIFNGIISINWFGAVGDGDGSKAAANSTAILAAMNMAAAYGYSVFVPKGTYVINPAVLVLTTIASDRFVMFGEGGSSIIKVADNTITADFKRVFLFTTSTALELIEFRDLYIDNNARGSTPPATYSDYQHCHTFAMSPAAAVKIIRFDNVIIKDPAADGFNHSNATTEDLVDTYIVNNCAVTDRTRFRNDVCTTRHPLNLIVNNFRGSVIHVEENVGTTTKKRMLFSNVRVNEFTLTGYASAVSEQVSGLVEATLTNVIAPTSFALTGVKIRASECVFGIMDDGTGKNRLNNAPAGTQFDACTFRLAYDGSGTVTSLLIYRDYGQSRKTGVIFNGCRFVIDTTSPFDPVTPGTNPLIDITQACPLAEMYDHVLELNNCKFDPRAYRSINVARCGTVVARDCRWGGTDAAAYYWPQATANGYGTDFTIDGGDFSDVTGALVTIGWNDVDQVSAKGYLRLRGDWCGVTTQLLYSNNASSPTAGLGTRAQLQIKSSRRFIGGSTLPTSGLIGDIYELDGSVLVTSAVDSYRCTVSSASAPTWKARTFIEAAGYTTGAGGTVTQATSKSTAVTINKMSGKITTHNAALATNAIVSFTVNNSLVAAGDVVILSLASGDTTVGSYNYQIDHIAAGSFGIELKNISAGSLSEALVFNFAVIRAVSS